MNTTRILQELRAERDRLDQAITAIEGITSDGATRPTPAKHGRRRMSAAGRKRISEAAKAMWARRRSKPITKKAAPKPTAAKKPGGNHRISPAARKRLSQLMKQRWATGKMRKPKKTVKTT